MPPWHLHDIPPLPRSASPALPHMQSVPSIKNFQLAFDSERESLPPGVDPHFAVLQFGRCGKDKFILDYCWPLCAAQAFAIVMASLDPKAADTPGYESLRKLRGDVLDHGDSDDEGGAATPAAGGSATPAGVTSAGAGGGTGGRSSILGSLFGGKR